MGAEEYKGFAGGGSWIEQPAGEERPDDSRKKGKGKRQAGASSKGRGIERSKPLE